MRRILFLLVCLGFTACAGPDVTPEPAAPATPAIAPTTVDSLRVELRQMTDLLATVEEKTDSLRASLQEAAPARTTQAQLEQARDAVQNVGLRVFWAFIVVLLTVLALRFAVWLLERLSERSAQQRLLFKKLIPIFRVVLWGLAAYVIIRGIFQVTGQGLLAAAAAIGVAIGFAAQDILKNIFGGLVIIFDQPFQVGDKIEVGGTYGEVVSIGLRSTRIVTPDDNLVSVPNSQVSDGQVSNGNAGALDLQVVTDLWLPGWIDAEHAKRIAYQVATTSKYVFLEKPIVVIVKNEFKETFLIHLRVKAYVIDTRYEFLLLSDITERANAEFRKHGLLHAMYDHRVSEPMPPPAGDGA